MFWVLKPKGPKVPPGAYVALVTMTYHPDGPETGIRFKFTAFAPDETPIGVFVGETSPTTVFERNGQAINASEALSSLRQARGQRVRIVVERAGALSRLSYESDV
jgi:hypothetical protein